MVLSSKRFTDKHFVGNLGGRIVIHVKIQTCNRHRADCCSINRKRARFV